MKKGADLTGQRFGKLTVMYEVERKNGRRYWHCKCDCGNEKDIRMTSLTTGVSKGCGRVGCVKKKHPEDIIGKTHGFLTVLGPVEADKPIGYNTLVRCRCKCGNMCVVKYENIIYEHTKSCGCLRVKDIAGNRYGALTALNPTDKRISGNVVWRCKCDCGNICYVISSNLETGNTKSCGCMKYTRKK